MQRFACEKEATSGWVWRRRDVGWSACAHLSEAALHGGDAREGLLPRLGVCQKRRLVRLAKRRHLRLRRERQGARVGERVCLSVRVGDAGDSGLASASSRSPSSSSESPASDSSSLPTGGSGDEPANPASCAYCLPLSAGELAALPYDGTADDDDAFPQPQRPSPSRDADAVSSTAVAGVNGASSGGSSHDVSFVTLL